MPYSIFQFVILMEDKFIPAPGHEREGEYAFAGEKSATVFVEGAASLLNSGAVTLLVLPVLAAVLYAIGYRVAGPLLGLFTLGLFLARMFGAEA